jgi:hypothetical protein
MAATDRTAPRPTRLFIGTGLALGCVMTMQLGCGTRAGDDDAPSTDLRTTVAGADGGSRIRPAVTDEPVATNDEREERPTSAASPETSRRDDTRQTLPIYGTEPSATHVGDEREGRPVPPGVPYGTDLGVFEGT